MSNKTVGFSLALVAGTLGVGVSFGGCGGVSISAVCDQICTCQPCTDADRKDCEQAGEEAKQKASDIGCLDEFDAATSCFQDNLRCQNKTATTDQCNDVNRALSKCSSGKGVSIGGIGGDACTAASDHLVECLGGSVAGGGTTVECTSTVLCSADCINAADCAGIKDAFSGMPTDASKSFLDCSTKCATAK